TNRGLFAAIEDAFDAVQPFEQRADARNVLFALHVDVSELVIGDGKRATGTRIELLESQLFTHADVPVLSQQAIDVDGSSDLGDAVFREHDHAHAAAVGAGDELPCEGVQLLY